MNYGLQEIIESVQDYLGKKKLPFIPYREDGTWRDSLPVYENQTTKIGEETSGCTIWGWLNAFEIFVKGVYGIEPNYSERFVYLILFLAKKISPQKGTDPLNTINTILEDGLVDDKDMPMTRTLEEFLDTSDLTGSLRAKGQNWLVKNELLIDELWNEKDPFKRRPANYKEILKENLKRCPIPMSVSAWHEVDGVYVSDQGSVNNHFCVGFEMIDYKQYKDCVVVFDTYDHSIKILHPDHNIRRAFAFWIGKRTKPAMKKHVSILTLILNRLMSKQTFLEVCESALGTDVTPKDTTPDDVACAEVVSTLIKKIEPAFPIITGTATLWEYLDNPIHGFQEVKEPSAGCIIISPTGYGDRGAIGHTGVVLGDGIIASNTSYGIHAGKFMKNHTIETWKKYYTGRYHFPVYYFKKIS